MLGLNLRSIKRMGTKAAVFGDAFTIITPVNVTVRRARIAVDVTIDGQTFRQQAEALVTLI
jgi:hypothetical protein